MKKLLILMLALIAAVSSAAAFSACDFFGTTDEGEKKEETLPDGGDKEPDGEDKKPDNGDKIPDDHKHEYNLKIDPKPTASKGGTAKFVCTCGDIESTVSLPALGDSRYNKGKDTATCGKGGSVKYTISVNGGTYMFDVATPATGKHTYVEGKCACGATDPNYAPHAHSYVAKSDERGHWTECSCGDKTELKEHKYTYGKDESGHWQICSVGKEIMGSEPHTLVAKSDESGHWKECVCGSKTAKTPHAWKQEKDAEFHWSVCTAGGEIKDKAAHAFVGGKCACGAIEDPKGVRALELKHAHGEGKYFWSETAIAEGKFSFYDAVLKVTFNDGTVSSVPLSEDMIDLNDFRTGPCEIGVTYGGKRVTLDAFLSPDNGLIEVAGDDFKFNGKLDTLILDKNSSRLDFGDLSIEGEFSLVYGGRTFEGYYGETPVDERFVVDIDKSAKGIQECDIKAGNISASPRVIGGFNAFGYDAVDYSEKVYLSDVLIYGDEVYKISLSPVRPYIDLGEIADREEYLRQDCRVEFVFGMATLAGYSGGGETIYAVEQTRSFAIERYSLSGDNTLWSVLFTGEKIIRLSDAYEEILVPFTVYDSNETNIRICRDNAVGVLNYELKGGVTLDSIKKDLLKHELYVEYFKQVDGKYVHFVPVTADMIDFDGLSETSFDIQLGHILYGDKSVAVNITKPYTVSGAQTVNTLRSKTSYGVNLILSQATVDNLAKGIDDACKEIVLYDNGVAMLKHTKNSIGNVLCGYRLAGNKLTLIRHGFATTFLTVDLSAKTFDEIDLDAATAGMSKTEYVFSHYYFPDTSSYVGWSGRFTAYEGDTGFEYSQYVNVHLSGWASTPNSDGYAYQIAGIEYCAAWAYGWHNNKQAFVLRFADKDWWFEIGAPNDDGAYRLTFLQTSAAS